MNRAWRRWQRQAIRREERLMAFTTEKAVEAANNFFRQQGPIHGLMALDDPLPPGTTASVQTTRH